MPIRKTLVLAFALFAGFGPFIIPSAASANDDRQVWRDTEGQIVHDYASGTCVREDSATEKDVCAQPREVTIRTEIEQEDRTIYFEFNRAALTDESKSKLDMLAEKLKSASDVQGAMVAGYADRIGTVSYDELLSKKRAENVRDYLIAHDIINTKVTKTRWFGKSEPSTNCLNDLPRAELIQCLQPDRKVQVDIVYRVETPKPAKR